MNEIWIEIPINNKNRCHRAIIAISNLGNMKRRNGVIEPIPLRQTIGSGKRKVIAYRLLMEHFKPKTQEDIDLCRDHVDHITHNPIGMNVNDVRNLRWCTIKENNNFEEAKHNRVSRQLSEESKRKMSERAKGRKSPRKGCKLSEETKQKISESLRKYNANKLQ